MPPLLVPDQGTANVINAVNPLLGINQVATTQPSGGGGAAPSGGGSSGGGGGGGSYSYVNPNQGIIDALNRQLQSLGVQQGTGENNITNSYNLSNDRLNQGQSEALSNYAKQDQQNATNREQNFGQIGENARSANDGLLRLLGLGGAAVSSVAQNNLPYAVSRQATTQRTGAQQTFGQNADTIDTARTDAKTQYGNALTDLLNQKNSTMQNFESGILNAKGQIESQLANAGAPGAAGAVGTIQNQLDNLFRQYQTPSFNVSPVTVKAPDLAKFTADPLKIQSQAANPNTDASVLPYLPQVKQQAPNVLTGSGSSGTLGG